MSIPIPLTVRLSTSRADRHVTNELRELTFRDTAIGGWASATMSLDRPLNLEPDEIAYYGRVYIYDARSGRTVWEGRLEDPGRGNRGDGQVWDITALGAAAHLRDRTVPLIYVDRQVSHWIDTSVTAKYISQQQDADPPGLRATLHNGTTFIVGDEVRWLYLPLNAAGMLLGRLAYSWDAGWTDANVEFRLSSGVDGSLVVQTSAGANTAGGSLAASRGGSPAITAGHDKGYISFRRITSNALVTIDNAWGTYFSIVVRGLLKDVAGADIITGYSTNSVLASEVVKDLLGRLLTSFDGANAAVTTTTYAIEQLAYPDGVNAAKVLDDLLMFEPEYRWGAYESNDAGKNRFEFVAWPTAPRYEADITDGFDSPGSADGLYNAVRVRWRDEAGQIKSTRRTSTVAVLTAAGLTREAIVDMGDDLGNSANAVKAGDQFLAEHQLPPNAGRLTIARPVLDIVSGRVVMPWEIKAGELIRVRGLPTRVDVINPALTRDGITVFRIVAVEYATATAAATLELDSYVPSTARTLAGASISFTRRR